MKNVKQELLDFSIEKLEERKEFTFYHHHHNHCKCECEPGEIIV